jgi:RimJ/RimL family protein N-acetyltransferase
MRFIRFGITLQRLEADELEMVRQWRNSKWVRPYMHYRKWIAPEEQMRWFQSLDSQRDWYFTARVDDVPIALFDIKEIDWIAGYGESGGFAAGQEWIWRPELAQATLALMDFAFLVLRLRSLQARYRANLPRIVRFNERLGYLVAREDDGFLHAQVTAERYLEHAALLRTAAVTLFGPEAALITSPRWLLERLQQPAVSHQPDFQLKVL